jgi:hypothetical protein
MGRDVQGANQDIVKARDSPHRITPAASTSEGRNNASVDSAVPADLWPLGFRAAGVVKAAEYDRHESKNSKPDPNDAAAPRPFLCGVSAVPAN